MKRWFIALIGGTAVAVPVAVGAVVFAGGSGGPACDRGALAQEVGAGIARADAAGDDRFTLDFGEGCTDADVALAVEETARDWHAMPGGVVMRAEQHAP